MPIREGSQARPDAAETKLINGMNGAAARGHGNIAALHFDGLGLVDMIAMHKGVNPEYWRTLIPTSHKPE